MIIAATFMIVIFSFLFSELYQDNLRDKKRILAEDYAYSLQNEFIIAAESKPGYTRIFYTNNTLEGYLYDIFIIKSVLGINYTDNVFYLPIPRVNGNLNKGKNTIRNINNTICLNC